MYSDAPSVYSLKCQQVCQAPAAGHQRGPPQATCQDRGDGFQHASACCCHTVCCTRHVFVFAVESVMSSACSAKVTHPFTASST